MQKRGLLPETLRRSVSFPDSGQKRSRMSKWQAVSSWSRLILNQAIKRQQRSLPPPANLTRWYSAAAVNDKVVRDILAEAERDRQREREQRIKAGLDTKDIDQEDDEDYMRVTPLIEKLEKANLKASSGILDAFEEPTDSDSDDDDERFTPDAVQKRFDEFQRKFTRHEELLKKFTQAGTFLFLFPSSFP